MTSLMTLFCSSKCCLALSRLQVTADAYQTHIVDLKEQIKLLRDRLFGLFYNWISHCFSALTSQHNKFI